MMSLTNTSKYLLCSFILFSSGFSYAADNDKAPVTYYLSFETMDFLKDDYAAKYEEPTTEQRGLETVAGKFGKALHNGSIFKQEDFDKTAMSTWDLDTLLEVLVHHRFGYWKDHKTGHMEPYIWGTGRLKGESGCVAFWAKGSRTHPGYLFFQASSSFGRFEKHLLAIKLNEDNSIEAYIRDARYQYHRIESEPVWNDSDFNHIALSWDRGMGLTLYVNGVAAASNWGNDAWWTTQIPGLFHMPMCGFTYDELWIFDRPLDQKEINGLMKSNRPPQDKGLPKPLGNDAVVRLSKAFIGESSSTLPVVKPFNGAEIVTFSELFPEWAGDGCMQAPFVLDGKYELAWPQDYTSFTNILGDSDFHPEKVDFLLPGDKPVNYITMEGNLTDATMLAGNGGEYTDMERLFDVPPEHQLFFGTEIQPSARTHYRIPFLQGYGSPPGYKKGLHLSLTGDIRIHEASFYNIGKEPITGAGESIRKLYMTTDSAVPGDNRTGYAIRALNDRRNSRIVALETKQKGRSQWISPGVLSRLNLLSDPWARNETIKSVELQLDIRGIGEDDFMIFRLHDPGVPTRIWNSIVFRMRDFKRKGSSLRLKLDCTDIKLAAGDRLWLDVAFSSNGAVRAGGKNASCILVETAQLADTDGMYAEKALKPARTDFTKIYYWYYPWTAIQEIPDPDSPETFGGFFDIVTYPLIVTRTDPDNFMANTLLDLALVGNPHKGNKGFTIEGVNTQAKNSYVTSVSRDVTPALWPPVVTAPADGSPEWAFYMNYYLTRYRDIVYWWAEHQNPDGQVGGGWNDDVLFASRLPGVFLYSGDKKARTIFNRIFEGLERTRMFHDGYCNIDPMDYIHVDDLVRNRYEGLVFEPGDPHKMKISMRTAWRFEKPDETPVNYIDGNSFKYDRELILWYWGDTPDYPVYTTNRERVTVMMKKFAPSMDEVIKFRYTEAGMFTDGAYMPGSNDIKRIQVGGGWGPYRPGLSLAVSWEGGGEPEIPKWVEAATDTSFTAHIYSYDTVERDVSARLYRLVKGIYRVTLDYEGEYASFGTVLDKEVELGRFSEITVPVRPEREFVLHIDLVKRLPDPGRLPDLACSDIISTGNTLKAVISNFGPVSVSQATVRVVDKSGRPVAETTLGEIESAEDFVPGEAEANFSITAPVSEISHVIVDPEDEIEEIFEGNNRCDLTDR